MRNITVILVLITFLLSFPKPDDYSIGISETMGVYGFLNANYYLDDLIQNFKYSKKRGKKPFAPLNNPLPSPAARLPNNPIKVPKIPRGIAMLSNI